MNKEKFFDENDNLITQKKCGKCFELKDFSEFTKSRVGKYKIHHWCRECLSKYSKEIYERDRKDRIQEINLWNIRNRDKTRQYGQNHLDKTSPNRKRRKLVNKSIDKVKDISTIPPELNF